MKKVYVALRFAGRPDLHMTLRYYGERDERQIEDLIEEIDLVMVESCSPRFTMSLGAPEIFGWVKKVRALVPTSHLPAWLYRLTAGNALWRAHVVCEDDTLELPVDAVALMCKDEELHRWNLTSTT